jgi:hypothetical protein
MSDDEDGDGSPRPTLPPPVAAVQRPYRIDSFDASDPSSLLGAARLRPLSRPPARKPVAPAGK